MSANALATPRFVRRTTLNPNEYRKNFHQLDCDAIAAVTSAEADRVTPLMSKIYLRLVSAPAEFWERQGLLYFAPKESNDGRTVKASKVLYEVLGVASATAHKALAWMHEQGIIGYAAAKNGAGIRIFLNRASSSIGARGEAAGKKILTFPRGSNSETRGSAVEPPFKDSFADQETLEPDIDPLAPKNGADKRGASEYSAPAAKSERQDCVRSRESGDETSRAPSVDETLNAILSKLEPAVCAAASVAAAREHERTREWLENRGLPKVARVAQREAYGVLRQYGIIAPTRRAGKSLNVGRTDAVPAEAASLSAKEVEEFAEICVMMLATHGQSLVATISEMSVEAGGFLLPEDAPKVLSLAEEIARAGKQTT
ncbi:MAG: hypothetical protein QOF61_27 [Acidobacteriota bacterium]|nr:hypothetical protein [Acidobacteriota bacterium]